MARSSVAYRRSQRQRDLAACRSAYRPKFRWLTLCVYCGMDAETRDHVFPVSLAAGLETWRPGVRAALGQGLNTVPACSECNSIARDAPFTSILAKRQFIQSTLRKRLASDLLMPDWSAGELAEAGAVLRAHIVQGLRAQERAVMRCNWPHVRKLAQ